MQNIKAIVSSQINVAYDTHINCPIDKKLLNVVYLNSHGTDYTMKSLYGLSKTLQEKGISKTIEELYNILASGLDKNMFDTKLDRNCLNINLKLEFIIKLISESSFDFPVDDKKQRILVDFSSPNIAKDMHVGHLRSTIIGDSICKLFELQGHEVHRINHIGDFGLQFGMIIEHLLEKHPDYEKCNFTISDLQNFYAQSKKRFDSEEIFQKNAYYKVVLLQSGDEKIIKAWNFIKEISRQSYNEIYNRLNIKLTECGESFYQNKIPALIKELEEKHILEEDEGRKIIRIPGSTVPLTVIKSDGGFTYDTTDLAAIRYRLVDLNMDKVMYVVDIGQELHFQMIFKVAEMMGWKKINQEVTHIAFGVVLGPDGKKFKSRNGDTVKLIDLLDEALVESEKALNALKDVRIQKKIELNEDDKKNIIESVAYSSIKYADLATMRTMNYKFSFEKMLLFEGNTGAYQLYAYVRICSILRHAAEYLDKIDRKSFCIKEKEEINICKMILLFPEIIETLSENLMFNILCKYLYDLASTFTVFVTNCRCLNFNEKKELINADTNRLIICVTVKKIIEKCYDILGITKLEKI